MAWESSAGGKRGHAYHIIIDAALSREEFSPLPRRE